MAGVSHIPLQKSYQQSRRLNNSAKALSQIAGTLPRVDLKLLLYPIDHIRMAAATVYSHIVAEHELVRQRPH